jgi:hypothetical protein
MEWITGRAATATMKSRVSDPGGVPLSCTLTVKEFVVPTSLSNGVQRNAPLNGSSDAPPALENSRA